MHINCEEHYVKSKLREEEGNVNVLLEGELWLCVKMEGIPIKSLQ